MGERFLPSKQMAKLIDLHTQIELFVQFSLKIRKTKQWNNFDNRHITYFQKDFLGNCLRFVFDLSSAYTLKSNINLCSPINMIWTPNFTIQSNFFTKCVRLFAIKKTTSKSGARLQFHSIE